MWTDPTGQAWYHWAIAGGIVLVAGIVTVATAGGFAPAAVAISNVAMGVAAASTATTIAAGVFIGSGVVFGGALMAADYSSAKGFADSANWWTVGATVVGGAYGGFQAYILDKNTPKAQETIQKAADSVKTNQTGAVSGTQQHTQFAKNVNAAGNANLKTEVSYLNGKVVAYGTPGSVRLDVVQYDAKGNIMAIYDLKTGSATLTSSRITEIQSAVGNSSVPVIEIKPR